MTKVRDIITFLGKTETNNTQNKPLITQADVNTSITAEAGNGVATYNLATDLPLSGNDSGDMAYVGETNRLYLWNGSGWYNITLVNNTPYWDSEPNSTYSIVDSATPLIITLSAADSEGIPLTYSGVQSDSAQYLVDITSDSSVFTFTPLSADSVYNNVTLGNLTDSDGGDFTYTFKASDGISFVSKVVTINYTGLAPEQDPAEFGIYLQNVNYPINQGSQAKVGFRYVASNQQAGELSATGINNMWDCLRLFPGDFIDRLEFADGTNIKFRMYSSTGGTEDDGRTYTAGGYNPGWTWDTTVGSPTNPFTAGVQSDYKIQTPFYNNTATFFTDPAGDYSLTDITWGTYDGTNDWTTNTANRIIVTAIVGINGTRWDKDNVATWNGNMSFPPPNS